MTEQDALDLIRSRAQRQFRRAVGGAVAFVVVGTTARIVRSPTGAWWEVAIDVAIFLAVWGGLGWFIGLRPMIQLTRAMRSIDAVVFGRIARIRAGLVTVDVPGERPREWSAGRKARRLRLGDGVWLLPVSLGETEEIIAVCLPKGSSEPLIVWGGPVILSSLLRDAGARGRET